MQAKKIEVNIPQQDLIDLSTRLQNTRWLTHPSNNGWEKGVPTDYGVLGAKGRNCTLKLSDDWYTRCIRNAFS